MSKKHYEALAEAMRAIRPITAVDDHEKGQEAQWYQTIDALTYVLSRDNGRFDEDRFRAACYRRNE